MTPKTLNLWGKGAVTLPKEFRDMWKTELFLADINEMGHLVIKPIITDDVVYYEDEGRVGLHFPRGIPAGTFLSMLKEADAKISREEEEERRKNAKRRKSRGPKARH